MGELSWWHWLIVALVALLLFGGWRKLPDAARALGQSMRIFKAETRKLQDDGEPDQTTKAAQITPASQPQLPSSADSPAMSPVPVAEAQHNQQPT